MHLLVYSIQLYIRVVPKALLWSKRVPLFLKYTIQYTSHDNDSILQKPAEQSIDNTFNYF